MTTELDQPLKKHGPDPEEEDLQTGKETEVVATVDLDNQTSKANPGGLKEMEDE